MSNLNKQKIYNNRSINKSFKIGIHSDNIIEKPFNVFTGEKNLSEHLLQYYHQYKPIDAA